MIHNDSYKFAAIQKIKPCQETKDKLYKRKILQKTNEE